MVHDPADQPEFPAAGFSDPGLDESELRARRSLGLGRADAPKQRGWNGAEQQRRAGATTHHKSRFVQDGEVPVVLVSNRAGRPETGAQPPGVERARLAEAESATRRERSLREQAERELATAQAHLRDLQTRLAHAELARDEAQAAERAALEKLEAMSRAEVLAPADAAAEPAPRAGRGRPRSTDATTAPRATRRKPLREHAAALPSDQPVKWWLSGDDDDDDEDAGDAVEIDAEDEDDEESGHDHVHAHDLDEESDGALWAEPPRASTGRGRRKATPA